MQTLIAFLRAVNVGGTGKLPMAELRAMAEEIGFASPRTLIASGNLVFETSLTLEAAKSALEARLETYAGKPVGVIMRTPDAVARLISDAPFQDVPGNKLLVLLLDREISEADQTAIRHQTNEEILAGEKALYIHYPDGQGRSKLTLDAAREGTARNMNTLKKVHDMC